MISINVKDADRRQSFTMALTKKTQKVSLPAGMQFDDPLVFYSTYWVFYVLQERFEQDESFYPSDRMYVCYNSMLIHDQKKISERWFKDVEEDSRALRALGDSKALVLCSEVIQCPSICSILVPADVPGNLIRLLGFHCEVPVDSNTARQKILETITIKSTNVWSRVALKEAMKSCLAGTMDAQANVEKLYMGGYKCNEHSEIFFPVYRAVKEASGHLKITEALEGYRQTFHDRPGVELTKTHFLLYARSLYLFDLETIIDEKWNRALDFLIRFNITLDHAGNLNGIWYTRNQTTRQHERVSREQWRQETGATKRIKLE